MGEEEGGRSSGGATNEGNRETSWEETARQHKQREKEIEELGLALQPGLHLHAKVPPLLSASPPPKTVMPMPTSNSTAHTSRTPPTDLTTTTTLQFAALSLSPGAASSESLSNQRCPAQRSLLQGGLWWWRGYCGNGGHSQ